MYKRQSQEDWKSDCAKTGYISILKNDLQRFQNSLKHIVDTRNNISGALLKSTNDATMQDSDQDTVSSKFKEASIANDNGAGESTVGASNYVELKQFLPISLDQQIHTISLQGVSSSFSHEQIELLLDNCLSLALAETQSSPTLKVEAWSSFSSFLETQDIFLRFSKVDNDEAFVRVLKYWTALFTLIRENHEDFKVELHLDLNTQEYIKDRTGIVSNVKSEKAEMFYSTFKDIESQIDEIKSKKEQLDDSSTQYLSLIHI